jgi:MFS-type transporter involved in bile tolerance (Atg22 family)
VGAFLPAFAPACGDVQDLLKVRGGTVLAWSLYELGATSFAMNMLSLYFPLDIATRVERGNERFSIVFSCSMLVVAIAAPLLGHLADRRGKRRLLIPFVLSGITLTALVAATGPVWRVLAFFALANIAFQCAYVFYNALLSDVSDSSNAGRVSGYGVAAGYVGSLFGMAIAVPFVSGAGPRASRSTFRTPLPFLRNLSLPRPLRLRSETSFIRSGLCRRRPRCSGFSSRIFSTSTSSTRFKCRWGRTPGLPWVWTTGRS